ncbi:hypothetical protein MNV49_005213 [Pseudohyphozyma bogoriensis]|nr:hypothetical protein MNV49_005213 [Pseudohyphozyma bogoriensis]
MVVLRSLVAGVAGAVLGPTLVKAATSCPAGTPQQTIVSGGVSTVFCCDSGYTAPATTDSYCKADLDASSTATTYTCTYAASTTRYTYKWPSYVGGSTTPQALKVTLVGEPGQSFNGIPGGAGDSLTGTITSSGSFGNPPPPTSTAAVFVGYKGGSGNTNSQAASSSLGGNGGGFSAFSYSNSYYAPGTSQNADGRLVVAAGGGGAGSAGPGGSAGAAPGAGANPAGGNGGSLSTSNPVPPATGGGVGTNKGYDSSGSSGGNGNANGGGGGGAGWHGGGGGGYDTGSGLSGGGGAGASKVTAQAGGGGKTFTRNSPNTNAPASVMVTSSLGGSCTLLSAIPDPPPEPTKGVVTRKKRTALELKQAYLAAHPACPHTQRACPLPSGNFECIDFDELSSCGGCVTNGTGVDCLADTRVQGVQCLANRCVARSCVKGFKLRSGGCV